MSDDLLSEFGGLALAADESLLSDVQVKNPRQAQKVSPLY